ncbi:MAG: DeoR/GlpR transcriptional regulator [Lachnospiraceae bacterium]|nr:DeoR/GlpR transcriptional regulator [Lachnospiraceae bacterium]
MFNTERQEAILNLVIQKKSISVKKLSELLYVSQPTIRRDLSELEKQGTVKRTHGGVMLRKVADNEVPLVFREEQNNLSKRAIAEKASKLISDGDVIFLDASSTASYLIPYLEKFKDIIVITNSPKTSIKLGERQIKNYCTGGLLLLHSIAYVGSDTENFISKINADIFFFSSRGITQDGVITDSSIEEATVKKAMMKNAAKCYFLCDSSKIGQKYMYNIANAREIDGVITELN